MYATDIYYYFQRQDVVLLDGNSRRSYVKVYSKELTIIKGVDNQIQFQFLNQEQKPVNVDGKEITARIISYNGTETIIQKTLMPIFPITGLMSLQVTVADLADIDVQKAYYSIEIPSGTFNYPVFVDSQGGGRGVMNIVNSTLPSFVAAEPVSVPSHPWPPAANGNSTLYYTSTINTGDQDVFTLQTQYANFTGNTQLQGSILADFSLPYAITDSQTYANYSGTVGINITGYHPYVRLSISNTGTPNVFPNNANISNVGNNFLGGDVVNVLFR